MIAAGSRCDLTIGLVDFFATCAQITGVTPPGNAGVDSVSILPIMRGLQHGPLREAEVHHSVDGHFAIRRGKWKLELCAGSGGWAAPGEPLAHEMGLPEVQLYNMETDEGEQHNVQAEHPEVVQRLQALLQRYVDEGRSTPGPREANAVPVDLWKYSKGTA